MTLAAEARVILCRVADRIGFPRPSPESGLTEWYDTVLDTMVLRGTHERVQIQILLEGAFNSALLGHEPATEAALVLVRDTALQYAARKCACRRPRLMVSGGVGWCAHCRKRTVRS